MLKRIYKLFFVNLKTTYFGVLEQPKNYLFCQKFQPFLSDSNDKEQGVLLILRYTVYSEIRMMYHWIYASAAYMYVYASKVLGPNQIVNLVHI